MSEGGVQLQTPAMKPSPHLYVLEYHDESRVYHDESDVKLC